MATSGASGGKLSIGSYDEYGVPGSANSGRFGYTGQAWLPEVGLWYYKARMYAPGLGRFLQTDPVGYGDGMNWYGYVGGDPVNSIDPTGLETAAQYCGRIAKPENDPICDILVKANKPNATVGNQAGSSGAGSSIGPAALAPDDLVITARLVPQNDDIVVTANRHRYVLSYLNPCPASAVFGYFKQAGHSAPGAPAAREGFTPRLVLTGGNRISQSVNSSTGTIVNATLPGHRYYPGTVTIQVTPLSAQTSTTVITGEGTGAHSEENVILGEAFFGSQGAGAQNVCGR